MLRSTNQVVSFLQDSVRGAEAGVLAKGYGIFALAYHSFTLELLSQITAGGFQDPPWVSEFAVRFADRYRVALASPGTAPEPWRMAFEAAEANPRPVLQHLLLGINAHMSYDLCAVLVDLLASTPPAVRAHDMTQINVVIEHGIGPVQRAVAARFDPYTGVLDRVGLGIDELATWKTFTSWRLGAWDNALSVLRGETDLPSVERRVAARARVIRWLVV